MESCGILTVNFMHTYSEQDALHTIELPPRCDVRTLPYPEKMIKICSSDLQPMSSKVREKSAYCWSWPAKWHHFLLADITSGHQQASWMLFWTAEYNTIGLHHWQHLSWCLDGVFLGLQKGVTYKKRPLDQACTTCTRWAKCISLATSWDLPGAWQSPPLFWQSKGACTFSPHPLTLSQTRLL